VSIDSESPRPGHRCAEDAAEDEYEPETGPIIPRLRALTLVEIETARQAMPTRKEGPRGCRRNGQVTGTKDKDYNIIWFVEQCLSNALRLEAYIQDAEREGDSELANFFRRAQGESRKGAEQGKQLLRRRIA
jgi:hypothetical protein